MISRGQIWSHGRTRADIVAGWQGVGAGWGRIPPVPGNRYRARGGVPDGVGEGRTQGVVEA